MSSTAAALLTAALIIPAAAAHASESALKPRQTAQVYLGPSILTGSPELMRTGGAGGGQLRLWKDGGQNLEVYAAISAQAVAAAPIAPRCCDMMHLANELTLGAGPSVRLTTTGGRLTGWVEGGPRLLAIRQRFYGGITGRGAVGWSPGWAIALAAGGDVRLGSRTRLGLRLEVSGPPGDLRILPALSLGIGAPVEN